MPSALVFLEGTLVQPWCWASFCRRVLRSLDSPFCVDTAALDAAARVSASAAAGRGSCLPPAVEYIALAIVIAGLLPA